MLFLRKQYYVICKKHQELGCILIKYVDTKLEALIYCKRNKDHFYRRLVNGSKIKKANKLFN